ncbi:YaaL family protein [Bacillus seohaeanensis]|jgi:Protein of unknown function (DUF2508)|uniref:YaaL family protein n=1 Tax=Bacillus seohaeanensis TaxID=284580 RepID=A0ABW5RMV2_9BACI
MFFRKKGKLRKEYNDSLIQIMEESKRDWLQQEALEELSMDQNLSLQYHSKIAESKYFFLLREAKHRKIVIKR